MISLEGDEQCRYGQDHAYFRGHERHGVTSVCLLG